VNTKPQEEPEYVSRQDYYRPIEPNHTHMSKAVSTPKYEKGSTSDFHQTRSAYFNGPRYAKRQDRQSEDDELSQRINALKD
jgi:hypothetical protein